MRAAPLVSALCTIYNAERFMRGLLEDLEAQTIADRLEIVIVDSASPQNERAVVEEFQRRYDNIVYVRTPERENSHVGFNRCIDRARGKYLTMACADDRHKTDAFERMAAVLDSRPDVALVYANSYITRTEHETFDRHTRTGIYRWVDFDPVQLLHGCYVGPQPMWRRRLHETHGALDGSLLSAGDWDFWLRLAERERFLHVDEFLGLYLYSAASSEHHNPAQSRKEAELVAARYAAREPALLERRRRASLRLPARSGVRLLIARLDAPGPALEACVEAARRECDRVDDARVEVVRAHAAVPENGLGVRVSPETPLARDALREATAVGAAVVGLFTPDAVVEEGWLTEALDRLRSDPAIAAITPARGGLCLLLRSEAVRAVGGIADGLPLSLAIQELLRRFQAEGLKVVEAGAERLLSHAPPAEAPDLDAWIGAGQSALERGDLPAALAAFHAVTRAYPDLAAGHTALGSILLALGRPKEAVAALRCAIQLDPADANAWSQCGVALHAAGDSDGAEAALQRAIECQPAATCRYPRKRNQRRRKPGQRDGARAGAVISGRSSSASTSSGVW